MDISELRKRIVRAIEEAKREAAARRARLDEAVTAYDVFLNRIAIPMLKQTTTIVNASGGTFVVSTPAETVRMSARQAPETYLEIALDRTVDEPEVVGRVSLARGRQGIIVDERPIAPGRPIEKLTEEDLADYLVKVVPRLLVR